MTNEQLARFIQQGGNDGLIPILWENVKKLIYAKCDGYYNAHKDHCKQCGVELWDIRQAAYIAFLSAVRGYKPGSDYKFVTFLTYPLRTEINKLLRINTTRTETLNECTSLNKSVGNDEDECELVDLIADSSAADMVELVEQNNDAEIVRAAVETLPERLQCVIRLYYFDDINLEDIAQKLEIPPKRVRQLKEKALRELRKNRQLRKLYSEQQQHLFSLYWNKYRYSPEYFEICKKAEEKQLSYGYRQAEIYAAWLLWQGFAKELNK